MNEDSLLVTSKQTQYQAALPVLAKQLKLNISGVTDVIVAADSLLCMVNYTADIHSLMTAVSQFPFDQIGFTESAELGNTIMVPACYDSRLAPDLNSIATRLNMGTEQIIELHQAKHYRVKAIGFMPGFAYLAGLDKRIQLKRKAIPATSVPKGSIAIAEDMTAVYPAASPGGWHIIGRSPMIFFNKSHSPMCPLQVGDSIGFYSISYQEYQQMLDHL
ncbi:carboxyltransferase domain-containing protein [Agarivorans sp. TSD2052]|uniref:5-oxoprolinase subunit B family protein n=1 Tax=Agarivorans sp. TSD2052 TaxID=2937286 RepID=UPI00200C2F9D|nr:carboxyltransferase domain-containing protein [Agarivorans sp. TSD2052]UPW20636.1 carboxyltransferase domain-containing protein [Agarivorans sp. TSD2052]